MNNRLASNVLWSLVALLSGVFVLGGAVKLANFAWNDKTLTAGVGEVVQDSADQVVEAGNANTNSSNSSNSDIKNAGQTEQETPQSLKRDRNAMVSMLFVGDILVSSKPDEKFTFQNSDFLKRPHITFGNLEGPVSDKGKKGTGANSFRMNQNVLDALVDAGFDALSVANNHIGDWGKEGFDDTLNRLKENDILTVGADWNKGGAEQVKIITENGVKIGFLGFSDIDVGPVWLEAKEKSSGIAIVRDNFESLIKVAASQVDYLVVSLHFGEENQSEPNIRQKKIAHMAIDAGAKIVIGHHSHVIQEVENYNKGIIAYSLGNFVFDGKLPEVSKKGLALEVIVDKNNIVESSKEVIEMNEFFKKVR